MNRGQLVMGWLREPLMNFAQQEKAMNVALTRLAKWQEQALSQGRIVLRASRVEIYFTLQRHHQTVEFPAKILGHQKPEFYCVYPTHTISHGDIVGWIYELIDDGKTRLWVPTELCWRTQIIGGGLARIIPLDGKITGSAGMNKYRQPESWWVSFYPTNLGSNGNS